jgi:hypothetical protein
LDIFECEIEMHLHREIYIALLNSYKPQGEQKKAFLEKVGISEQYWSYIRSSNDFRIPSEQVAEKIANALFISKEEKETLLSHITCARKSNKQVEQQLNTELSYQETNSLVKELENLHNAASFTDDPMITKISYDVLRRKASNYLKQKNYNLYPLLYAKICIYLSEVESILGRPDKGLYYASLAYFVCNKINFDRFYHRLHLLLNALDRTSTALICLGLYSDAYKVATKAIFEQEQLKIKEKELYNFWTPHLNKNKIEALSGLSRFSQSEVEGLANKVRKTCEHRGDKFDQLQVILLDRSISNAYLNYGNLKKAFRALRNHIEDFDKVPHIGPLHKTMILETYARICWVQKDYIEWEYFIKLALTTAKSANLISQIKTIETAYDTTDLSINS